MGAFFLKYQGQLFLPVRFKCTHCGIILKPISPRIKRIIGFTTVKKLW